MKFWFFLILLLLLTVVGAGSYLAWRQSVPEPHVTGTPPGHVGAKTPLAFAVEAVRGTVAVAEVRMVQGSASVVVARKERTGGARVELTVTLDPASGVREGPTTLEIWARDDFWRPLTRAQRAGARFPVTVDFT